MSPIRGACAAAAHAKHSNAITFLTRDETRGNSRHQVQFGDRAGGWKKAAGREQSSGTRASRADQGVRPGVRPTGPKEKPHRTSPLKTCKASSDAARPGWAGIRRRAVPLLVRSASYSSSPEMPDNYRNL